MGVGDELNGYGFAFKFGRHNGKSASRFRCAPAKLRIRSKCSDFSSLDLTQRQLRFLRLPQSDHKFCFETMVSSN